MITRGMVWKKLARKALDTREGISEKDLRPAKKTSPSTSPRLPAEASIAGQSITAANSPLPSGPNNLAVIIPPAIFMRRIDT
jgi:hypothetical protein